MASATNSSQSSPVPSGSPEAFMSDKKSAEFRSRGQDTSRLGVSNRWEIRVFFRSWDVHVGDTQKKNWWEHDDHPFKPVAHHWQNHISAISNSIVSCWVVLCPGPTRGTQQSNWQDYYVDFVKMIQRNVKTGAVPRGSEFFNWIPNIWP